MTLDDLKAILALVDHSANQAIRGDTLGFQLAKAEIERRLTAHLTPTMPPPEVPLPGNAMLCKDESPGE